MVAAHQKPIHLQETELQEAVVWIEAHQASIPASVYKAVLLLVTLRTELERTKERASKLLALFRQGLGLTPKSERGVTPSDAEIVPYAYALKSSKPIAHPIRHRHQPRNNSSYTPARINPAATDAVIVTTKKRPLI